MMEVFINLLYRLGIKRYECPICHSKSTSFKGVVEKGGVRYHAFLCKHCKCKIYVPILIKFEEML